MGIHSFDPQLKRQIAEWWTAVTKEGEKKKKLFSGHACDASKLFLHRGLIIVHHVNAI